jgi:hypothetical protein
MAVKRIVTIKRVTKAKADASALPNKSWTSTKQKWLIEVFLSISYMRLFPQYIVPFSTSMIPENLTRCVLPSMACGEDGPVCREANSGGWSNELGWLRNREGYGRVGDGYGKNAKR